jgi:hypothetical protein
MPAKKAPSPPVADLQHWVEKDPRPEVLHCRIDTRTKDLINRLADIGWTGATSQADVIIAAIRRAAADLPKP